MENLNKLLDNNGEIREEKTGRIIQAEKVGKPEIVKIHRNYREGLIRYEIWKVCEKTNPDANGYALGEFEDEVGKETRIALVQFYKY